MKRICYICFAASFLFTACGGNEKKGVTFTSSDGKEQITVDTARIEAAAKSAQERSSELQKLTPYTAEELKALIPKEIMGIKRTRFSSNNAMGVSFADATYKNDSKKIELNIVDCAGEAGYGRYNVQFMSMMNLQTENENGYNRTVEFNGGKAIEYLDKKTNRARLTYLASNRLLVTLEGRNATVDELKQAASTSSLK